MQRGMIGAAVISLAFALASCGDDGAASTTTTTTMPPPVTTASTGEATTTGGASDASPGSWAEFEGSFMTACAVEYTETLCRCMFDEFQQRYEFADFFSWAYQAQEDPRIVEVVDLCGA